jgi:DNA helicase-2/ATP-dependent DNA helicase PcrA
MKEEKRMFNWSRFQLAIFEELKSDQNLVVEAKAGAAKSTVLEECNRRLPESMKVLNVAFNKHIAEALQKRLPRGREAGTLNSVGWRAVRGAYRGAILNPDKDFQFLLSHFNMNDKDEREQFGKIAGTIRRTVDLFKSLNFQEWPENWVEILDTYGVETGEFEEVDQFPYWAEKTFNWSIDYLTEFSFADQIYQVLRRGLPLEQREMLFVDETQDLSPMQIELIKRLGRRIICVGDRHQSIYVFRGADLRAMDRVIEETSAKVMPLSICYRCSKSVIREAQKLVPEIEHAPDAIEGSVSTIKKEDFYKQLSGNEMVTCRNTAPLIRECLRQLGRKQKAFVRGRDIGDKIYELVDKVGRICRSNDLEDFLPALADYSSARMNKLMATGRETEAELLQDRVDSIRCFAEDASTIQDVFEIMNEVFSDANKIGTEYSTVHKAKGREIDNVYRLEEWLCPSPKTKPHLLPIEHNIKYVEITRAKTNLFSILPEKR